MANDNNQNKGRSALGNPIDPSTDATQLMNDTTGLTGVTVSGTAAQPQTGEDLLDFEESQNNPIGLVSIFDDDVIDKEMEARTADSSADPDELLLEAFGDSGNGLINEATPPHVLGEMSVSGDMPHPESDDDMLLNSHQVGLRLDEDYDDPKPLNVAADVAAAERSRRGGS